MQFGTAGLQGIGRCAVLQGLAILLTPAAVMAEAGTAAPAGKEVEASQCEKVQTDAETRRRVHRIVYGGPRRRIGILFMVMKGRSAGTRWRRGMHITTS